MTIDTPPTPPGIEAHAGDPSTFHKVIGQAKMQPDGTITMQIRVEDPASGAVGHAYPAYAPGTPKYQAVLDRLGPFKPGDTKSITDEWYDNPP